MRHTPALTLAELRMKLVTGMEAVPDLTLPVHTELKELKF
jgi:hypothetical protein